MKIPYLSNVRWFKVLMIVAGVCITMIISFFLFAILIVWGFGYVKGVVEIENMLIGSWVIEADSIEKTQELNVLNADGTWVCNHADDTLRKGKWRYIDEMQIKINETEVTIDNVSESVNHERLITIVDLKYDEIVCKEGNRQFVLKRIRNPESPKSSLNNEENEEVEE